MKIQLVVIFPNCSPYKNVQKASTASAPKKSAVPLTTRGGFNDCP